MKSLIKSFFFFFKNVSNILSSCNYGCITYDAITSPGSLPFAPLDNIVIGADTVETLKVLFKIPRFNVVLGKG